MAKGKKLPRFDVSKAGQGGVAVGALCHATFSHGGIGQKHSVTRYDFLLKKSDREEVCVKTCLRVWFTG